MYHNLGLYFWSQ